MWGDYNIFGSRYIQCLTHQHRLIRLSPLHSLFTFIIEYRQAVVNTKTENLVNKCFTFLSGKLFYLNLINTLCEFHVKPISNRCKFFFTAFFRISHLWLKRSTSPFYNTFKLMISMSIYLFMAFLTLTAWTLYLYVHTITKFRSINDTV